MPLFDRTRARSPLMMLFLLTRLRAIPTLATVAKVGVSIPDLHLRAATALDIIVTLTFVTGVVVLTNYRTLVLRVVWLSADRLLTLVLRNVPVLLTLVRVLAVTSVSVTVAARRSSTGLFFFSRCRWCRYI